MILVSRVDPVTKQSVVDSLSSQAEGKTAKLVVGCEISCGSILSGIMGGEEVRCRLTRVVTGRENARSLTAAVQVRATRSKDQAEMSAAVRHLCITRLVQAVRG